MGQRSRLVFTGDLGRKGMAILRDPFVVPDVDYLIIESTYGDRFHDPIESTEQALRDVVVGHVQPGRQADRPCLRCGPDPGTRLRTAPADRKSGHPQPAHLRRQPLGAQRHRSLSPAPRSVLTVRRTSSWPVERGGTPLDSTA